MDVRHIAAVVSVMTLVVSLASAAPAGRDQARFTSGADALAIPFELVGNHIHLRVGVNGQVPLTFILDTGASVHIVGLRQARATGLNLEPMGRLRAGVGAATELYQISDALAFSVPGATLEGQHAIAASLDLPPECRDQPESANAPAGPDGVLGRAFFDSFVVEIDYAARLVHLHDPSAFTYTGRGQIVPLDLRSRAVTLVKAQVKGAGRAPVTAWLFVDTGASTALTLNQRFAEIHGLLPPPRELTPTNECGVGGAAAGTSYEGTLESVEFGPVKVARPVTFFRATPTGSGADGLLGGDILRRFKVIFDFARSRMILETPGSTK